MPRPGPKITQKRLDNYEQYLLYIYNESEAGREISNFSIVAKKFTISSHAAGVLREKNFINDNGKWLMGVPTKIMTRAFYIAVYERNASYIKPREQEIPFPDTKTEESQSVDNTTSLISVPVKRRRAKKIRTFSMFWGLIKFDY